MSGEVPKARGFGTHRFEHRGWIVEAKTAPISKDAEVEALKDRLSADSMPEQLFGDSYLRLTHESGACLDFNAAQALAAWHAEGLPPVQVGIASQWQQERKSALERVAALKYDWTFTTPYAGSLHQPNSVIAAKDAAVPTPAAGEPVGWQPSSEQLDMVLLTARDPILFFAEVPLYESELDDNGASQLSVKVRAMPNCWYVLMRFFLRVDRKLVRLRETRMFCDLRRPCRVLREVKHMEATLAELSGNAATGRGVAHADGDSTALALSAIAPNGVKLFSIESLQLPASPRVGK